LATSSVYGSGLQERWTIAYDSSFVDSAMTCCGCAWKWMFRYTLKTFYFAES